MPNLQERAQELIQERNELITRVQEINGALQELDRLAQAAADIDKSSTTTEEEENG
tara:strand:- start:167 stop:334 length:168 start_codon:yes stop_codon:yes gene_type:complete